MNATYDDYDDDLLRRHYEQELEFLRRDMRAFARRYPEAAARLSINSDGRSEDPAIERLAQSAALLHARHSAKIDDDYPELSEALIARTYPQYLRPFPSCSIAQFDIGGMFESLMESVLIERGTLLETNVGRCAFRTAYDVVLAPIRITQARYTATPTAPPGAKLPPDASGMVSMTLRCAKSGGRLGVATPAALRVHVAGQAPTVAALLDVMLLRTTRTYLEDAEGRWMRLADVPVKRVGFGAEDWLFTDAKEPGQTFGLLGEYFAFAQRFHFIDLDVASPCAVLPEHALTLHLVQTGAPQRAQAVQHLAHVCADNFKLFCTPVVNLFRKQDVSLKYDPKMRAWPLEAQGKNEALGDVWSVDEVRLERGAVLRSSAALFVGQASNTAPTWTLMPGNGAASSAGPARTPALRLDGIDGPVGPQEGIGVLQVDLTCSNGDTPRTLAIGAPMGDIKQEGKAAATKSISLLHVPTPVARLSRANGALWRLIGQQTMHVTRLNQPGLPAFKQMLQQFAVLSQERARHIDGIAGLRHRAVMTLIARKPQPAMVRGIEITLVVDEQLFIASSVAIFAGVMERFFAPCASTNSFIQLVVVSVNGDVLWKGPPLRGTAALL